MSTRARISYSNKDYESIRRELIARIPLLTDRWTDFNASDLGIVLLELFCGVGDMLAYYLDAQANEAFLPTARQRQSVINLCKLIGYRLDGPVAATTTLRFSVDAPRKTDLLVPERTTALAQSDDGEVWFESAEPGTISAGSLVVDIPAIQGRRRSITFELTGEPGEQLELPGSSIANGSISLAVQSVPWVEVTHFQDSDPDSPHFLVETDGLDVSRITFGDGTRGATPSAGSQVVVSWLEALGEAGNLGAGVVTTLGPTTERRLPLPAQVTNPVPATGGRSRESIPHARAQAPAELRSLWKAVTKEDYLALALGFPGVAKAQVVDINDCANLRYFQVNLAIAPNGGGPPSPLLKRELLEFLESRKVVTVEVRIFDPIYRPVSIDAEVFAFAGEDPGAVRSRCLAALEDHFAFANRSFGQGVFVSDVTALLDGIRGVSHVRLYAPHQDVTLSAGQIATLGEVTLQLHRATA